LLGPAAGREWAIQELVGASPPQAERDMPAHPQRYVSHPSLENIDYDEWQLLSSACPELVPKVRSRRVSEVDGSSPLLNVCRHNLYD